MIRSGQQIKTACTRDCPDACGLIATVENGRIVQLQGDKDHPVTQGFLCHRTSRFLDRQYSSDRLTQPLFRASKSEDFQTISWESAYDLMADKMRTIRDQSGGAAIMQYRCGGSMGILKHIGDYFFERFGPVTVKSGDVCAGAGEAAQLTDFGEFDSNDLFDLKNSKTIFIWGKNVFVSSVHLIPLLREARKRGATIVNIDPVQNRTSTLADVVVQPRPGGDAALAMGIARWLFENNRHDPESANYCDHWESFREEAFRRTLEQWAEAADVSLSQLVDLAERYADGPTALLLGWGMQRRKYGAATIRVLDALASISGNVGRAGGGASFYFVRRDAYDFSFADPDSAPRKIPEPLLGPQLLELNDPPVRMIVVWGANPVAMLPDSATVAEALRTREFTVVIDPFLTDSARCANLVLPTTTMLEEEDLLGAYGHHYLAEVKPVVPPPPGVRSDYGIFRELAKRLDLADPFDVDEEVWKQRLMAKLFDAGVRREEFLDGYVKNPFVKEVLFADRKFPTASGKVNLIHRFDDAMFQPRRDQRPLVMAISTEKSQASQWPAETQQGPADAVMHPDTAGAAQDGELVTLHSERGELTVRVRLDDTQRRDTVVLEKGGWHQAGRSGNALVEAELTDDGECAVYYDTAVHVRPAAADDNSAGNGSEDASPSASETANQKT